MTTLCGPLALVGSGEYTPAMNDVDRVLMARCAPGGRARVALIPTASGLEAGMPDEWNRRGVAHFSALGADPVALPIVTREDCAHPDHVATLEKADLIYFSGGNPNYLIESWRDTPAWQAVYERHRAGAALAGCSAGAMMLGAHTLRVRDVFNGLPPVWTPALGVARTLAVMPHFDRTRAFISAGAFAALLRTAPAGVTVIGVDEDTALIGDGARWTVAGRQTVTVFSDIDHPVVFAPGQPVPIP
jgi:cyanophycinase